MLSLDYRQAAFSDQIDDAMIIDQDVTIVTETYLE